MVTQALLLKTSNNHPKYLLNLIASKGLGILLKEQGHHINQYIFANIGTGTSLHYYNGHHQERVGGIGTGGGMIRGLGYLLTEISDYETLTNLAQSGNRDIIDLKVKHIYKDSEPPIPGELTAQTLAMY